MAHLFIRFVGMSSRTHHSTLNTRLALANAFAFPRPSSERAVCWLFCCSLESKFPFFSVGNETVRPTRAVEKSEMQGIRVPKAAVPSRKMKGREMGELIPLVS